MLLGSFGTFLYQNMYTDTGDYPYIDKIVSGFPPVTMVSVGYIVMASISKAKVPLVELVSLTES